MPAAPDIDPTRVGVKKRFAWQDRPLPILPPQLSLSEKSPLITRLTVCADPPLFVIVTTLAALVTPMIVFGKVTLAAETVMFCAHELALAVTNNARTSSTR